MCPLVVLNSQGIVVTCTSAIFDLVLYLVCLWLQLSDDERTPSVIRTCLEKREMKADPSEYILVQVLSNGSKSVAPRRPAIY